MSEAETTAQELAKVLASIYAAEGYELPLTYSFTRNDIPTLRARERIRVVVIREHDEPQHPIYERLINVLQPV